MSGHALANKILRAGYYWPKMEAECIEYVRKCHKCQIYANDINQPATALSLLASPLPFSMWGLDSQCFCYLNALRC